MQCSLIILAILAIHHDGCQLELKAQAGQLARMLQKLPEGLSISCLATYKCRETGSRIGEPGLALLHLPCMHTNCSSISIKTV